MFYCLNIPQFSHLPIYWRTSWLLSSFSNCEYSCCKYLHISVCVDMFLIVQFSCVTKYSSSFDLFFPTKNVKTSLSSHPAKSGSSGSDVACGSVCRPLPWDLWWFSLSSCYKQCCSAHPCTYFPEHSCQPDKMWNCYGTGACFQLH